MNYIFQLAIIFGASFAGEILYEFLPFPIPASVYGLLLLFILLCTKIVKLEQVEKTAEFLISIMPFFFIGPTVGIIESYSLIQGKVLALFLASFLSFAGVNVVTALTAQFMIRWKNRRGGK